MADTPTRPQPIRPSACPQCGATHDLKLGGPVVAADLDHAFVECLGCEFKGPRVAFPFERSDSISDARRTVREATEKWNAIPRMAVIAA